jgi:hypothetical protein
LTNVTPLTIFTTVASNLDNEMASLEPPFLAICIDNP